MGHGAGDAEEEAHATGETTMADDLNEDNEYESGCVECNVEYIGWFPQDRCPVCGSMLGVTQTFSNGEDSTTRGL